VLNESKEPPAMAALFFKERMITTPAVPPVNVLRIS
jgi:hypothetical protein